MSEPTNSELAASIAAVVTELRAIRAEMATKADIAAIRVEMATKADLAAEVGAIRAEMATRQQVDELRNEMIVRDEDLRSRIVPQAEQNQLTQQQISALREDLATHAGDFSIHGPATGITR